MGPVIWPPWDEPELLASEIADAMAWALFQLPEGWSPDETLATIEGLDEADRTGTFVALALEVVIRVRAWRRAHGDVGPWNPPAPVDDAGASLAAGILAYTYSRALDGVESMVRQSDPETRAAAALELVRQRALFWA